MTGAASATPARILVIKLRALGDVVLSTIVLNNLRAAYPGAEIDVLTEPPADQAIAGHPSGARPLVFRPKKDSPLPFFWKLYHARYDLVIDLFCNPRSAQMAFATRAPLRVGYPFRGRAWAYNSHVVTRAAHVHNTEFNLDALRHIGVPIVDKTVTIAVPPETRAWARDLLAPLRASGKPIVALNPGCSAPARRWGLEHFAQLADRLHESHHAAALVLWGPGEEDDAKRVQELARHGAMMPPRTNIKQLAALLAECDGLVSNDTGPMHIGAAAGIPVLCINGPTNPLLQGPYNERSGFVRLEGLDCLACNLVVCKIGNMCMRDLDVDRVHAAFSELLSRPVPKG